ncbi:MAG: dephospho-CoA kinase [Bacteroidales bacterium]|nr:dephospho-CoA kinase [Bacteroidales bacterium]
MIIAGITGGIGSGKTTVCKAFSALGVPVYNADLAARIIVDNHDDIRNELIDVFGNDIFEGNTLNRPLFASLIFHNKKFLAKANSIIHPRVKEDFIRWTRWHKNYDYVIEETAILFESGNNTLVDKCITVISPIELKIKRLMNRPGMTEERIKNVMENQWTDEKKQAASDYTIINDEKNLILPQVFSLHQKLTEINHNA